MRLFRHYGARWSDELSILAALENDVIIPVQLLSSRSAQGAAQPKRSRSMPETANIFTYGSLSKPPTLLSDWNALR